MVELEKLRKCVNFLGRHRGLTNLPFRSAVPILHYGPYVNGVLTGRGEGGPLKADKVREVA